MKEEISCVPSRPMLFLSTLHTRHSYFSLLNLEPHGQWKINCSHAKLSGCFSFWVLHFPILSSFQFLVSGLVLLFAVGKSSRRKGKGLQVYFSRNFFSLQFKQNEITAYFGDLLFTLPSFQILFSIFYTAHVPTSHFPLFHFLVLCESNRTEKKRRCSRAICPWKSKFPRTNFIFYVNSNQQNPLHPPTSFSSFPR